MAETVRTIRQQLGFFFRDGLIYACEALARTGPTDLLEKRVLILAAHCDDEALGCSGLVQRLVVNGNPPRVAIASAGGKGHIGPSQALSDVRRSESVAAMRVLGLAEASLCFGDLPDSHFVSEEAALEEWVEESCSDWAPEVLVATAAWDANVDHRALGRVTRRVARRSGVACYEYFVWGGLFPATIPAARRAKRLMGWEHEKPWAYGRPLKLPLDPRARDLKRLALGEYRSQLDGSAARTGVPVPPGSEGRGGALSAILLRYCLRSAELFWPYGGFISAPAAVNDGHRDLETGRGWLRG